jgi:hypothetical protein
MFSVTPALAIYNIYTHFFKCISVSFAEKAELIPVG